MTPDLCAHCGSDANLCGGTGRLCADPSPSLPFPMSEDPMTETTTPADLNAATEELHMVLNDIARVFWDQIVVSHFRSRVINALALRSDLPVTIAFAAEVNAAAQRGAAVAPRVALDARMEVEAMLADVEQRLAQGKGTWPNPDYIRDETWAHWQGEAAALRAAVQAIGGARE